MATEKHALSNVTVVYEDAEGNYHRQPVSDISDVGTLIDPDTGDDMEMSWVEVSV